MANSNRPKRPMPQNPINNISLVDDVRSITNPTPKKEPEGNEVKQAGSEKKAKRERSANGRQATSVVASNLADKIKLNFTKFNGRSDTGKPIYVSTEIVDRLSSISNKYHRRLSVRAIARAVLDAFINDFEGEKVIDEYMKEIGYEEPSDEELALKKKLADKARQRRKE